MVNVSLNNRPQINTDKKIFCLNTINWVVISMKIETIMVDNQREEKYLRLSAFICGLKVLGAYYA